MLVPVRLGEATIDGIEKVFIDMAKKVVDDVNKNLTVRPYMNKKMACEYLNVSFNTLIKFEKAGMPKLIVEGIQFFRKEDIDKFMEKRLTK